MNNQEWAKDIKPFEWEELDGKTLKIRAGKQEGVMIVVGYDQETKDTFVLHEEFSTPPVPTIKPGDEGLYNKYTVINNETGKQVEGACFVLRPDRDNAAYGALLLYAELTTNTDLAMDLTRWLSSLEVPHG